MISEKVDKVLDIIDVPILHVIAISITFTNVENALKITSLILAIGYTAWKWISEYKNKNEKNNNKRNNKRAN